MPVTTFGISFEALKPAPMLLGLQTEFKDHGSVAIREPEPLVR